VQGFTYSDVPAGPDDNVDSPSRTVPAAVRAGWAEAGWKGFTVSEAVRVLPVESLLGAAALGFVAARAVRRLRNP
jgi:hypothetical protein